MMSADEKLEHPTLVESLSMAVGRWVEGENSGPLGRWLARELDAEGVPRRLAIRDWPRCLEVLAGTWRAGGWPPDCEGPIAGFVLAALRFTRPDGSRCFSIAEPRDGAGTWLPGDWADRFRGTGIARIITWWFDSRGRSGSGSRSRARSTETGPPPLPAWSAPDRVLAILRPDWLADGDFLAVDHRDPRSPCGFELRGTGRTWLGPEWGGSSPGPDVEAELGVGGNGVGPASRPRPSRWVTSSAADLVEWTDRRDGVRVTRSALLLRGRRLALISTLAERRDSSWAADPTLRLTTPPAVAAGPIKDSRALAVAEPGRRGAAHVLPIALPCLPYPTDRGSFRAVEHGLILRQAPSGRRCWLPLLVSWDAERHRKPLSWRVLTVSERARAVGPDRAFAARVSWGRDETYVVYRSLGPPAPRAFLGHQTAARFLVAGFTSDGDLRPIFTVE
jgi:hypothetical protein